MDGEEGGRSGEGERRWELWGERWCRR